MTRVTTVELAPGALRNFATPRPLRIVAVQLESPFAVGLKVDRSGERLHWDSRDEEQQRVARVTDVLEALVQDGNDRTLPDIVLFPEYSVPETAHAGNAFQSFADRHRTILVPGTYYCNKEAKLDRLNVCRVYIPDMIQPLIIVKRHPSPLEAKYLGSPKSRSNVLQMLLPISDGRKVALNVFICRDYLLPFDADNFRDVHKLWSIEGINFVLMHNEEARLFEGQAAPEVRRLRGPGRAVVFVNNASICCELGSALLAPSGVRERDDVVKSVPWDREGMLIATVRPWDVRYVETRPDRTQDSPVESATVSYFDPPVDGPVMLQPGHQPPAYRAVWKPAFLEAINRVIVIDLRVAKRLSRAIRALSDKNARFHAVAIRGVQDVLIRRYAYRFERKSMGEIPPLASFFTGLNDSDLKDLFEDKRGVLRVMIYPKGILKYRGVDAREEQFEAHTKAIARELSKLQGSDLGEYMDRLDQVGSLACEVDLESGIPEGLQKYFFEEFEQHIPIGYEYNNSIRETYILIALATHEDRLRHEFFNEMVAGALMNEAGVREIFIIGAMEGDLHFNYVVKLKMKDYETDRIIRNLRTWREEEEAIILTRTFDVTDYLKNSSVLGVANFDQGTQMSEFAVALDQSDRRHLLAAVDLEYTPNRRRIAKVASEWSRVKATAEEHDEEIQSSLIDEVYTNICFISFSQDGGFQEYLRSAEGALFNMYKSVEDRALEVLNRLVAGQAGSLGPAVGRLIETSFPEVQKNSQWPKIRDYPEKVLMAHLLDFHPDLAASNGLRNKLANARQAVNRLATVRNTLAHGHTVPMLEALLDVDAGKWEDALQEVSTYINDILQVLGVIETARLAPRD